MHTFPISNTGDEKDIGSHCREGWDGWEASQGEVLNPALVRAWRLRESRDVFPSVFVTESR